MFFEAGWARGAQKCAQPPSQLIDYLENLEILENLEKLEKLENPETPSSTSAEKSQPFAENPWQAARNYPILQYENQAFL
ncbi:MAG: hypothetical protein PUF09_03145 [Bacteroidales bacterium]|nr:hypothetical protein [Bacteroidales bacterium]